MIIEVEINTCLDCRYRDHSGAFTPGGSIPLCRHHKAPKRNSIDGIDLSLDKSREDYLYIFKPKMLNEDFSIPAWCPLKSGHKY